MTSVMKTFTWLGTTKVVVVLSVLVLLFLGVFLAMIYLATGRVAYTGIGLALFVVGSAAVYMALAIPVGRLADRIGRRLVFVAGYALLLPVYAVLLLPSAGTAGLVLALAALGAYYAATDGVLQAIASAVLPDGLRASGLALLVTAVSVAKLGSSVAFGLVWTLGGMDLAVIVFTGSLVVALLGATAILRRAPGVAP